MPSREVGRVVSLWRYPVKSMAGEALDRAEVSWHGIVGDRRWAFVRPGLERSGFPWLTIREKPDLWRYRPRFAEPQDVKSSKVLVTTPDGVEFDVVDQGLAAQLGEGVRVIKQSVGVFDTFPLSLLSVQSVEGLSKSAGLTLTPLRFRPNIVIDAQGDGGFPEDTWVGSTVRIGDLRMRVDKRDGRCVMTNIDPSTLVSDARVLKTIAQERDACLGVYGTTVTGGNIAVGDAVILDADGRG